MNDAQGFEPGKRRRGLRGIAVSDLILPAFILVLALTAGIIESRFFSMNNILNLLRQIVPLLIVSVGQAFAIIAGGLDLSIAAIISLAGVAGVLVMVEHGIGLGIATMLVSGFVIGSLSGAIIGFLKTTPLIVTLGMLSIAQAIALILSGGVPIYQVPLAYADFVGFGDVGGVPVMIIIGLATLAGGWLLLRGTVFGRYVYAIGSNRAAAVKSGVNVPLVTMLVYAVAGLCSGIGAVVLTAWVSAAQPVAAPNLTLESLAAVVLGGVALTGGSGGMLQVIYGVIILGMLSNAMNMIGISAYYQTLAIGVVIILAIVLDRWRRSADVG